MNRTKVFLDSNILIQAGKPPGGPVLERLKHLVNAGLVTVLTTDLTCREVAKKHTENDYNVIKEVGQPHFRNIVKDILGTKFPKITKSKLKTKLAKSYRQSTEAMLTELNCRMLKIDDIKPSKVLFSYTNGEGFFAGEAKKEQFPDAFIFECLKAEASGEESIIVVSNDRDFKKPVEDEAHISLVKSLPELFERMGLKIDAPDMEGFLECHEGKLFEAVNEELNCWGFVGDVPDSEIEETTVTDVRVIKLASFGSTEKRGSILIVGRLHVRAEISYAHPDWDTAMYSDDDILVWINDERVSGETEVGFNVDVSMSVAVDKNDNPKSIEELRFLNGDFQHIELHSDHYHD